MKTLIEQKYWLVVPPKPTKEKIELSLIDMSSLANDSEHAWFKFCNPSLRREAYESDGYKAVEVTVKVMV